MPKLLLVAHALVLGALALSSCTSFEQNEQTELQSVCVSSGNGTDGITTVLAVNVEFATCLSSSCDTALESSCEATVEGTELSVTGRALIESQVGGACTLDCGLVTAQCMIEVPNGTYLVRAGDIEFNYEVGTPAACSDDGP